MHVVHVEDAELVIRTGRPAAVAVKAPRKAAIADPSRTVFNAMILRPPMQCRLIIDLCPSKRPDGKNNTRGKGDARERILAVQATSAPLKLNYCPI